ncbi:hypothetical protein SteCoe_30333 [Stentor coeruleus]|uniref:Peptidase S1 domain-containing protein n=1 Tax=Stentor coeruleus TaxID=5963 RepID=A0A1R2B4B4_9CILI|nr:hypothetical protein SteCoe_30333 [Stentor coeruleus]
MHMRRKIGIGDIAIQDKKAPGSLIFQKTSLIRPNEAKKNVLINFNGGGTGFIISKNKIFIGGKRKKLAIVLTAGHVVCNFVTLEPYEKYFSCMLEDGNKAEAYFIKSYMKNYPDEHKSIFTNGYYCLPGDMAILLLVVHGKAKIHTYRLAKKSTIISNSACTISGYPCIPNNFRYCIPQLEALTQVEIENEARNIFCNFNNRVYAEGKIENIDNGIIEVSCSTTNGMSGSPIILNRKVVGVYVGGPPIPSQRECIKIIQRLERKENPCEIFEDVRNLVLFDTFFTDNIFKDILKERSVENFELYGRAIAGGLLTEKEKKKSPKKVICHNHLNT